MKSTQIGTYSIQFALSYAKMRIRIQFITFMRIRIQLITLMRIRILRFNLIRIHADQNTNFFQNKVSWQVLNCFSLTPSLLTFF